MLRKSILFSVVVLFPCLAIQGHPSASNLPAMPTAAADSGDQGRQGTNDAVTDFFGFIDGRNAFDRGDYPRAMQILRPLADRGDPEAQLIVGVMFAKGLGVPMDAREAAAWFQKSADQGNLIALNNLGGYYRDGIGVPQDYFRARELFLRGARRGDADAENNYGAMLANGQGGLKDLVESYAWLKLAAEQNQKTAPGNLEKVREMMSEGELLAGERRADELRDQIAATRRAQRDSGTMNGGTGVTDSEALAQAKAAYQNRNYAAAFRLFQPLAQRGVADAQAYLGLMYHSGFGVPLDYREAAYWYQKAADQGNELAIYNLGIFYRDGQGVPQDYAKARELFERSARRGDIDAFNNLGAMCVNGQGGPVDYVEGYGWLRVAADRGNQTAKNNLDKITKVMTWQQILAGQRRASELGQQYFAGSPGSTGTGTYF